MIFQTDTYYKETFIKLELYNQTIKDILFEECVFDDCRFVGVKFEHSKFSDCTFNRCLLSAIDTLSCQFIHPKFIKCKVMGFDWTKIYRLKDLTFNDCQINYSNFRMVKIPKTSMINCEAKETDFTETDLTESVFTGTDFTLARFFKTNLSRADFRKAKNYNIDVSCNIITQASFSLPEAMALLHSLNIVME